MNADPSRRESMPSRPPNTLFLLLAAACVVAGAMAAALKSVPARVAGAGLLAVGGALAGRHATRGGAAREQLEVAHAAIAEGVVAADARGRVTALNAAAERLTGWADADAAGRPLGEVLPLVAEGGAPDSADDLVGGRGVSRQSYTLKARGGRPAVPVELSAAPLLGRDGGHRGVVVVLRDVTAQREQARAVEAAQAYAEAVVDTVREPLVVLTPELAVRGTNRAFHRAFGGDPAGAVGRPLADLAGCDWVAPRVEERLRRAFADGAFGDFAVDSDAPAGRRLLLNARKVVRGPGEPELLLVAVEDVTARRAAEEQARAADAHLRLVVDSATGYAIFSTDAAGRVATWNAGAERVYGWGGATILGEPVATLFTPEDRAAGLPERELGRAARDGRAEFSRWHARQGGGRFFASGVLTPVADAAGGLTGYTKVVRDVTAAKRAEDELAASRRFLRSSLDALTTHIAVLDEAGVILEANGAWRRFADANGLSHSLGQDYLAECDAADAECADGGLGIAAGVRAVLAGARDEFVLKFACPLPGARQWYQLRATRFLVDGEPRVVVAREDVTARRQAEEATRARSDQLNRLAGVAAHVSVATDVKSVLGVVTQAARALVPSKQAATVLEAGPDHPGASAVSLSDEFGEFASYSPAAPDLYSAVHALPLPARFSTAELEAHPGWAAFAAKTLAPPLRGLLVAPLFGRDGTHVGVIQLTHRVEGEFTADDERIAVQLASLAAVAVDNARLYEGLVEADRHKDEFLAMLAHELRNPLAPIRNAAEALSRADRPGVAAEAQAIIGRQLRQLARLVDDLLDVSRVSRGQITLRKRPVDLREAVRTAVETSRPVLEAAGHELTVRLPEGPLPVDADPTRLTQIVGNLLTNAAKYTPPGGRIGLDADRDGSAARIRVTDTGVGLPPDMLTRVFKLFVQVDTSLERSQGGLGIGLTLVKRLVELHGGTVAAASPGVGLGSTFTVRLPASDAAPVATEPATPPVAPSRLKILVADDNADSAASLALVLSLLGHEVQTAADGAVAVALAEEFRPQVILTDIGMPKLNGYDVARLVRARPWAADTVVAALTGWGQGDDKERSRAAGVDYHLVKPVDLEALNRVLATAKPASPPRA